jgi:mono/diheme cytochrome c family protein
LDSAASEPSASGRSSQRNAFWRGLHVPALLAAAFLFACLAQTLSACNKKEASGNPVVTKGKGLFFAHCIACHNANPAVDGTLGPAIKGSSLELLKARVLHGEYPPGYTPKRESRIMQKLPLTEQDVEALHAFLTAP